MSVLLSIFLSLQTWAVESHSAEMNNIADMKKRSEIIDEILAQRFEQILPGIMRRSGIDMWVIMSREYNEDPVLKTMLPSTWMSARRHTMLVIYDAGQGKPLEMLAVARYAVGNEFKKAWDKEKQPDQWAALSDIIEKRQPKKIGINTSNAFALADGMSSTEKQKLTQALSPEYRSRLVSAEKLAIGWLETRSALEMQIYPQLAAIGHQLIATAFSNEVVSPGKTTSDDLVWWFRDQSTKLGVSNWFHPSVSIQRADNAEFDQIKTFSEDGSESVIQPGDLLHVDFGITYLRLNTDQQQHAYVLKPGETKAPERLQKALANANRLQTLLINNFKLGHSGNEILKRTRQQAISEGIKPSVYTHPLGFHGHAAGPTIGMWDAQEGLPVVGDYPLYPNTAFSIELNAATFVPEWNKEIRIMLEEDAFFDGDKVEYIDGRQTDFHLIRSE
nr:M24 family metallopeptidase [Alteromonas confluentis]